MNPYVDKPKFDASDLSGDSEGSYLDNRELPDQDELFEDVSEKPEPEEADPLPPEDDLADLPEEEPAAPAEPEITSPEETPVTETAPEEAPKEENASEAEAPAETTEEDPDRAAEETAAEETSESSETETPPEEDDSSGKKPKKRFLLFLLIYLTLAVLIAVSALCVLWKYVSVYEQYSQNAILEAHLSEYTDEQWKAYIKGEIKDALSPFETETSVVHSLLTSLKNSSVKFVQKSSEAEDRPVFRVLFDGREVITVTLGFSDYVFLDLKDWHVVSSVVHPEALPHVEAKLYQWSVPLDAELIINGVTAGEDSVYLDRFLSPKLSDLEPGSAALLTTYQAVLFAPPSVRVVLNGTELEEESDNFYDYPSSYWQTGISVTAPAECEVLVNGIVLGDEYLYQETPSEATALEDAGAYTNRTYLLPAMFDEPVITATGRDASFPVPRPYENNPILYRLDYPEEWKILVKVTTLSGAQVTLNDRIIGKEYLVSSGDPIDEILDALPYLKSEPQNDVYRVAGFVNQPRIKVTSGGNTLHIVKASQEFLAANECHYYANYQISLNLEYELQTLVRTFVKDYVYFSTQGYYHLDDNMAHILTYTVKDSLAYKRIRATRVAMLYMYRWKILSSEYSDKNYCLYSDDCFSADVRFSVSKKLDSRTETEIGLFHLLFVKYKGEWKLVSLSIADPQTLH